MTKKIIWIWRNRANGQEDIRVPEHLQDFENATVREMIGLWSIIIFGCTIWAVGIYQIVRWLI